MRSMIARNPFSQGWILVDEVVLAATTTYRQVTETTTEAGGILMGYRKEEHLHVDALTYPFETDKRSRFSFRRAMTGHASAARDRWCRSGHISDYLGEWHTHPEADPAPSAIDLREWRILLEGHEREMVFLIVGIRSSWLGVGLGHSVERVDWTEAD